jgi:hypothetical protein
LLVTPTLNEVTQVTIKEKEVSIRHFRSRRIPRTKNPRHNITQKKDKNQTKKQPPKTSLKKKDKKLRRIFGLIKSIYTCFNAIGFGFGGGVQSSTASAWEDGRKLINGERERKRKKIISSLFLSRGRSLPAPVYKFCPPVLPAFEGG